MNAQESLQHKNSQNKGSQKRRKDVCLWISIIFLISTAVIVDYFFSNSVVWALRLSGWIVLMCILALLVFKTASGQKFWVFAKEARVELRKVVWPKREETIRTTMIIGAMVIVTSMILWGMDSVLLLLVNWLSGGRG